MPKDDITPSRQQYLEIKREHPNTILFFRLGDFYETFDEDAEITSRELDIVLTSRPIGKGVRVPLAGIPYHAVDNFLVRLIEKEAETLDDETLAGAGAAQRGSMLDPARYRPVAWIERLADLPYTQLLGTWLGMVVVLAVVYWLLGRAGLGGLRDGSTMLAGDWQGFASALYFSLLTATSIGFGDIVPVGIVRLVAVVESAAALLVFGCLVSKLVSRHQEELSDETHRLAFDMQLGRVRTNLHLVLAELQSIESGLGDRNQTLAS